MQSTKLKRDGGRVIAPLGLRRWLLPRRSAVYAVWWFGWAYVGQSRNLYRRWCGPTPHHRACQLPPWALLIWLPCRPQRLDAAERALIALLAPRLNGTRVPRRRRVRWQRLVWIVAAVVVIGVLYA